ncbi:ABC transporter substrate-binding protein [Salinicola peritrichatus]|uniref:ABC transporter substrate-binding protein n=1 Tax=Salinicola peritrichatus TaxID=1267424 RepID=UPI000DA174E8|nr:ABC transporter substrate-binding protein [Salinicola peritrichatus]
MKRRDFLKGVSAMTIGASALPFLKSLPAMGAPGGTLVTVMGSTINSLDIHRSGTNRPSYQVAVNCYDRLVTFGTKTLEDGSLSYDYDELQPELATEWEVSDDGRTLTFTLRENATFQDGAPVTAADVKWSFDRAVTLGGFPTAQMAAGSLEQPEQFEAVDARTFRIHLPHASKLTLPDLTTPIAIVINSELAKSHATEDDPWATEYLHRNTIGSGAFSVERWDSGQQLVYARNDDWACGPLPEAQQVILREVPSTSTRRALVERGDAQLSQDIPPKDASELTQGDQVEIVSTPIENCLHVLCTNLDFEPFQDRQVRQAIAWAVPYQAIFDNAAYGQGVPMWGGAEDEAIEPVWPQPFPYQENLERARELMAQSAYPDGFEVSLSFDLGQAAWAEPTALLIQESLAQIGIRTQIERIPGANWRTVALVEKSLPLHLENFGGWLNTPDYYFYWAYVHGNLFNSSNYDNPEMAQLVEDTLYIAQSDPAYVPNVQRMIELAIEDIPRIPLYQPSLNVAMQPSIDNYVYWYHRQLDLRPLTLGRAENE